MTVEQAAGSAVKSPVTKLQSKNDGFDSRGQELRLKIAQVCSARGIVYGAVHSMLTLCDGLKQAGHAIEYVTFEGRGAGQALRDRGEVVHEVKVRAKLDPVAIFNMAALFKSRGYDIVHTHLSTSSVNGALAARVAGIPSVATVHGMSSKLSFLFAHHLITVSDQVKQHLVGQGLKEARITTVHNGIDFHSFGSYVDRVAARKEFGAQDGDIVVGVVSRVTEFKGIRYAVEACAKLIPRYPNIKLVVAGDGNDLESCRRLAHSLGISAHVVFLGYRTDVANVLSGFDVFLFPSLKEAMGLALAEAAYLRLPSVASRVGGIPEVVTEETGYLVPPADANAIAQSLETLITDHSRRESMGEAARERALELFSLESMTKGAEDVYRALLGNRA